MPCTTSEKFALGELLLKNSALSVREASIILFLCVVIPMPLQCWETNTCNWLSDKSTGIWRLALVHSPCNIAWPWLDCSCLDQSVLEWVSVQIFVNKELLTKHKTCKIFLQWKNKKQNKTKQTIQYIFLAAICLTFVHTYERKSLMSESIIHPVIMYTLFTYQHTNIEPRLSCSVFFYLVFVSLALLEYFFRTITNILKWKCKR